MLETGQTIASKRQKGVPLLIAAALALGMGSIAYVEWKRDSARPPEQLILTEAARAYLPMLDLGDVEMSATDNTLGQTLVEITGKLSNLGDHPVRRIRLNCVFFDVYGVELHRVLAVIVHPRQGLAPADVQEFRLAFDDIPRGWNQVMPSLYIAEIVFD